MSRHFIYRIIDHSGSIPSEVSLKIDLPVKLANSFKHTCKGAHF